MRLPRKSVILCCKVIPYGIFALMLVVFFMSTARQTIRTSEDGMASLVLDTNKKIMEAKFKGTHNNPDGSVDLIFRVSRRNASMTHSSSTTQHYSVGGNKPSPDASTGNVAVNAVTPGPSVTQQAYPLTLNGDFLINTVNLCPAGKPIDYIVVVHSATAYFSRRHDIRETYGGRGVFGNVTQRVVFLLGMTSDPETTKSIQQEALQYGDIVQGRFADSYHNLTHKAVMGFRWVAMHCPQARLVVKIDDDVFINVFGLVGNFLPLYASRQRHIACHVRPAGTSIIERGKGRWKVREDEFKDYDFYPFDYCNGYFVLITTDLIRPLLRAAVINPFFWIDDVYVFGVLPATVGSVTFEDIKKQLTTLYNAGETCINKQGVQCPLLAVSQYKERGFQKLWYSLLLNVTDKMAKNFQLFGTS
ncbi:beta-1,3-galactosyltransferase 1-like [Plakobranchus ocellatus]|uniref:Hexosyltransferase n=1 Tax=Plakobranchus ocellatus TaxID=259542 RepID=A0AAV4AQS0_9GAST|nr:beta-1,3-galactosyltransferase 1-like [Plakobranchus ocellatus]